MRCWPASEKRSPRSLRLFGANLQKLVARRIAQAAMRLATAAESIPRSAATTTRGGWRDGDPKEGFNEIVRVPSRRYDGRFHGFRINCERVPELPALAVRWVWDDPRRIPYLLLWKNRHDNLITEAVRIVCSVPRTRVPEADSVEIKRTDGTAVTVYLAWRRQPHGGRALLLRCWRCQRPARSLYGFKVGNDGRFYKAVRADWDCRRCAELRYASEGGYLRPGAIFRDF